MIRLTSQSRFRVLGRGTVYWVEVPRGVGIHDLFEDNILLDGDEVTVLSIERSGSSNTVGLIVRNWSERNRQTEKKKKIEE